MIMDKLPSYSFLLNERMVIPSDNTSYFAVDEHLFYFLMKDYVSRIHVDEKWYVRSNPDIADAIRNGMTAKDHYCRFGYFEHRMPYAIEVQEEWYLDAYPDIRDAVEQNIFISGQSHFDIIGYREGRVPSPGFSLQTSA